MRTQGFEKWKNDTANNPELWPNYGSLRPGPKSEKKSNKWTYAGVHGYDIDCLKCYDEYQTGLFLCALHPTVCH